MAHGDHSSGGSGELPPPHRRHGYDGDDLPSSAVVRVLTGLGLVPWHDDQLKACWFTDPKRQADAPLIFNWRPNGAAAAEDIDAAQSKLIARGRLHGQSDWEGRLEDAMVAMHLEGLSETELRCNETRCLPGPDSPNRPPA